VHGARLRARRGRRGASSSHALTIARSSRSPRLVR
jgi:hypothetical protein